MTKRPRTARRHDQSRAELKSGRCSAGCSAAAVARALDGRTLAWRRPVAPGARIHATTWSLAVARAGRSAPAHDPMMAWWDGNARGSAPDPLCRACGTAASRQSPARSRPRFPADTGTRPSRTAGTAVRSAQTARSSVDGGGSETAWVGDGCPKGEAMRPAMTGTAYALFSTVAPPRDSSSPRRFPCLSFARSRDADGWHTPSPANGRRRVLARTNRDARRCRIPPPRRDSAIALFETTPASRTRAPSRARTEEQIPRNGPSSATRIRLQAHSSRNARLFTDRVTIVVSTVDAIGANKQGDALNPGCLRHERCKRERDF